MARERANRNANVIGPRPALNVVRISVGSGSATRAMFNSTSWTIYNQDVDEVKALVERALREAYEPKLNGVAHEVPA